MTDTLDLYALKRELGGQVYDGGRRWIGPGPGHSRQDGSLSVRLGLGWAKSHSFFTGQTPVMKYNRQLMQAILWGRINIAEIVGVQVISLNQAPEGYASFDAGTPKKFVIDPHQMLQKAA